MTIAVDHDDWRLFRLANRAQMALILVHLAEQVDLNRFKKAKGSSKKPKAKPKTDKKPLHVSTLKMLLKSD